MPQTRAACCNLLLFAGKHFLAAGMCFGLFVQFVPVARGGSATGTSGEALPCVQCTWLMGRGTANGMDLSFQQCCMLLGWL